ncbi:MAG: class I SAM-dependent methyltransferase [Planctomycetota bacterium]|jgi:ubiquinone/menaquinone biosynthesis C-methylase UbiE
MSATDADARGTTGEVRAFYEYEADHYAITPEDEPAFRHRRTLVRRLLPNEAPARILDVGCGDGSLARDLAERTGAAVTMADLARRRVERARASNPRSAAAQASIYALPWKDSSFELVVCTDLLEHLDDPDAAMAELVRVSARHVLISVPYQITIEKTLCPHCGKDYFLYGHQHSFGREGVQRMATLAGARVVRFEHVIPMFECRRYKWFPPLKWLIWDHFKNSGTLGALIERP